MEAIPVIALAAIIIFLVRKRKKRARQELDLSLAVVGFEASGKTVYIGSMFNELRVPDGCFFLRDVLFPGILVTRRG